MKIINAERYSNLIYSYIHLQKLVNRGGGGGEGLLKILIVFSAAKIVIKLEESGRGDCVDGNGVPN